MELRQITITEISNGFVFLKIKEKLKETLKNILMRILRSIVKLDENIKKRNEERIK